MILRQRIVVNWVQDTLGKLPTEHLGECDRKLLVTGLTEMYSKVALQAVLNALAVEHREQLSTQLVGERLQQKKALKKLVSLIPTYSVYVQGAIRDCQSNYLSNYEAQVRRGLEM